MLDHSPCLLDRDRSPEARAQGSFPGSSDQRLHIDIGAGAFDCPGSELPIQAMPLFSLTVHYPAVEMCSSNGTIRIVPGSNRWADSIPTLAEEPAWMRAGCEVLPPPLPSVGASTAMTRERQQNDSPAGG